MRNQRRDDDPDEELFRELEPLEPPDESDMDDDDGDDSDEPEVVPCPYCGEEISEEAEVCPHCRSYISAEDAPPARKPWYVLLGTVALLAAILVGWVMWGG